MERFSAKSPDQSQPLDGIAARRSGEAPEILDLDSAL
jgi:hypothetical protein